MAQANAVQREPSMEEILASIRRIIEDSDQTGGAPAPSANDDAPAARASAPAATVPVEDFRGTVDDEEAAFRAGLDDAVEALDDMSLDPVGDEPSASRSSTQPPASAAGTSRVTPLRTAGAGPAETPAVDIPAGNAAPQLVADAIKQAAIADQPERASIPEGHAADIRPQTSQAVEPARASIISEQAGRQVAAAFGELSEAFAASRRRSFDEMAEEMMRPMLQEWMDNNLPHLVERLVREEIERIARGHSE